MRKHLTLNSPTSVQSNKKSAATETNAHSKRRSERHDVSPREFVIRNILNYSLALSVFQTSDTGIVQMVMN